MKIPGEYIEVSQYMLMLDAYTECKKAHSTPILPSDATLLCVRYTGIFPQYRGYRGRAGKNKITLPARLGDRPEGIPYLRVGIVLHEIAHTLTARKYTRVSPHGIEYCREFAKLLKEYYKAELAVAAGSS